MIHKGNRDTEARELPSKQGSRPHKEQPDFPGIHAGGHYGSRGGLNTGITSHSILDPSPCQRGQGEVEGEDGKSEVKARPGIWALTRKQQRQSHCGPQSIFTKV